MISFDCSSSKGHSASRSIKKENAMFIKFFSFFPSVVSFMEMCFFYCCFLLVHVKRQTASDVSYLFSSCQVGIINFYNEENLSIIFNSLTFSLSFLFFFSFPRTAYINNNWIIIRCLLSMGMERRKISMRENKEDNSYS